MATANYTEAKTETKVIEIEPAQVTLTLTLDEAQALKALTGRTHMNDPLANVYHALQYAGISSVDYHVTQSGGDHYVNTIRVRKSKGS